MLQNSAGKCNSSTIEAMTLIELRIWYWNCYPGARVDSDIPLYEYSIEDLYKDCTSNSYTKKLVFFI